MKIFIGRDLAHTSSLRRSAWQTMIDEEVKRIVDEAYEKARELIMAHEDVLHRSAQLLIEKEKISREEFEALF